MNKTPYWILIIALTIFSLVAMNKMNLWTERAFYWFEQTQAIGSYHEYNTNRQDRLYMDGYTAILCNKYPKAQSVTAMVGVKRNPKGAEILNIPLTKDTSQSFPLSSSTVTLYAYSAIMVDCKNVKNVEYEVNGFSTGNYFDFGVTESNDYLTQ